MNSLPLILITNYKVYFQPLTIRRRAVTFLTYQSKKPQIFQFEAFCICNGDYFITNYFTRST
jgi:hypothetical protein